jgi:hypothetical protein
MQPEENFPTWPRFFKLLLYAVALLYVAAASTLFAVVRVPEWHLQLLRFLYRAWQFFLVHVGSTGPGFISPVIVSLLSIIGTLLCIGYLQGRPAMRKHFWENAAITAVVFITVMLVVYVPQFAWEAVRAVCNDHQALVNRVGELHDYAKNKQQFDDELRHARSEAERWHSAYSGLSRGDIHPDRVLNSEESNKLFEALKTMSKDPRNKDYIIVELGAVQDREATRLGWQLYKIFHEAHWNIKPRPKLGKEFDQISSHSLPIGIMVWADDQAKGTWLGWMLKDAGLPEVYVNPYPVPQGFKGEVIWIGYKQWP